LKLTPAFPEARFLTPALTTVRQDFDGIGRARIELLLRGIDSSASAPEPSFVPELVVRESHAPARWRLVASTVARRAAALR
jgi:DNA-binding LacI/PurR family transcriptional regulator